MLAENQKLKSENDNISNQVHILSAEILALKNMNGNLKAEVEQAASSTEEKEIEIHRLNTELAEKKSLLQALQKNFDRVMEFLKLKNLKEEWEKFMKPVTQHKSR